MKAYKNTHNEKLKLRMENGGLGRRIKSAIRHSVFCILNSFLVAPVYCGVVATGGNVTRIHNDYIHTFTSSGTFTVTKPGTVQVLVVGGGGGGGSGRCGGGGGGAGGVVYTQEVEVIAGEYAVTVGAGGTGAPASSNGEYKRGTSGGASSFIGGGISITAKGGGRGGTGGTDAGTETDSKGETGGSGGGAGGYWKNSGGSITTPAVSGTAGQGNAGGSANCTAWVYCVAGGGGGAGAAGRNGVSQNTYGNGGVGIACSISGAERWYAGGGGGGGSRNTGAGSGGTGGGGAGAKVTLVDGAYGTNTKVADGKNAMPNTGGGGGGASGYVNVSLSGKGGNGGSGIVIVRYALDVKDTFDEITGGIKTRDGDYEIHTFTNSGTFKVSGCSLVDVLVVGGGGGGGVALSGGGGGGAGGVVYKQDIALLSGEYEIVVGKGGTGGVVNEAGTAIATYSAGGSASSALGFTAKGGGRGGNTNETGGEGASGGGGAAYTSTTVFKSIGGGDRVAGQGNFGGASTNAFNQGLIGVAGGGGGAGARGNSGVITSLANVGLGNYGGAGGDGIACSITGEEKWYGGGGGGGYSTYENSNEYGKSAGGKGGGGRGSGRYTANPPVIHAGTSGTNGTGGGGGGGGGYSPNMANGGKGGDGIVIIRCKHPQSGFIMIFK